MYDDKTFPEFADCRDENGVCRICHTPPAGKYDVRAHDSWSAADDATW